MKTKSVESRRDVGRLLVAFTCKPWGNPQSPQVAHLYAIPQIAFFGNQVHLQSLPSFTSPPTPPLLFLSFLVTYDHLRTTAGAIQWRRWRRKGPQNVKHLRITRILQHQQRERRRPQLAKALGDVLPAGLTVIGLKVRYPNATVTCPAAVTSYRSDSEETTTLPPRNCGIERDQKISEEYRPAATKIALFPGCASPPPTLCRSLVADALSGPGNRIGYADEL